MAYMKRHYELNGDRHRLQAELMEFYYGMEFYYKRKPTNYPAKCSVCGKPIKKGESQIEFLAGRVGAQARPYLHHLHVLCFLVELGRMFLEEGDSLEEAVARITPAIVLNRLKGK